MAIIFNLSCGHKTNAMMPPTKPAKCGIGNDICTIGDEVKCPECKQMVKIVSDASSVEEARRSLPASHSTRGQAAGRYWETDRDPALFGHDDES